jgi:tetratricopeptide (TPR) repeat protein
MARIEKTVFISYRRTNAPWALAVFQNLTHHGYDAFYDFKGIASGDFESAILENIKARAHFLVLLTPSALERCDDPRDWLRREIQTALKNKRNIVPLMLEGFNYTSPAIAKQLKGDLAKLTRYNALNVPADYFDEAMGRLREKYLNVPVNAILHPASSRAQRTAKAQQAAAIGAPKVQETTLSAQELFEQGFNATDTGEKLRYYSEAIRLKPDFAAAYNNRGIARKAKGDLDGALKDFGKAIRLNPGDADTYNNRGVARGVKGDLDGALKDFGEAIRLNAGDADAYNNRGNARGAKGDIDGAAKDFGTAIRLKPDFAAAYYNRGNARDIKGDIDGALKDYGEAIRLKADFAEAYYNRSIARQAKGDIDGATQDEKTARRIERSRKK